MACSHSWVLRLVVSLATVFTAVTLVNGQTILIDDFNDGDDAGWVRIEDFGDLAGPRIFDTSTGAYNLRTTNLVAPGTYGAVGANWEQSGDPSFSNGFLRAKVKANTMGTSVGLNLRTDNQLVNGYTFVGSTEAGIFRFLNCTGLSCSFRDTNVRFAPDEEWFIEAGAVDDHITMKVWQVGENEPLEPQLDFHDDTFTSGYFGVAAWISDGFASPVITDATFDDVYFVNASDQGEEIRIVYPPELENVEAPDGGPGGSSADGFRTQWLVPHESFSALPATDHRLTGFNWRPDGILGQADRVTWSNLTIHVSSTSEESLSDVFADNTGPDETLVYNGPITQSTMNTGPVGGPKDFDIAFPFQEPFVFDPASGHNLLIDLAVEGPWRWLGTDEQLGTKTGRSRECLHRIRWPRSPRSAEAAERSRRCSFSLPDPLVSRLATQTRTGRSTSWTWCKCFKPGNTSPVSPPPGAKGTGTERPAAVLATRHQATDNSISWTWLPPWPRAITSRGRMPGFPPSIPRTPALEKYSLFTCLSPSPRRCCWRSSA